MRERILRRAVIFVAITTLLAIIAFGQIGLAASLEEAAPDEILVKFRYGVSDSQADLIKIKVGALTLSENDEIDVDLIKVFGMTDTEAVIRELEDDPLVEYAELNYRFDITVTPNDPYFNSQQWALTKIYAPSAWDVEKGSAGVVIAIVDTGVSPTHGDLSSKIVPGYDFVDNDYDPSDAHGHGTHVAGTAAAATNNGIGVAGLAWNNNIMPIRVLNENGSGYLSDVADGIIWAADHGASVINLSLGSSYNSVTLRNAVNHAYSSGCVVVAAAGNSGHTNNAVHYPAAHENVIGVAATSSSDQRAYFSNYGYYVDIAAPGVSIYNTYWSGGNNTYASLSGTSMASPHVAGLAGLIASQNPSWTPDQIEQKIALSADDLGAAGRDDYYGHGRINAYRAVTGSDPPGGGDPPPADDDNIPGVVVPDSPINDTLNEATDYDDVFRMTLDSGDTITASITGADQTDFDLYLYPPGSGDVNTDPAVAVAYDVVYPDTFEYTVPADAGGTYYLDAYAYSGVGDYTLTYSSGSPARPTLVSPTDGADVARGPVDYTWGAVNGATTYAIELLDAPPEPGEENTNVPSVHRIAAAVSPNGTNPVFPGDTSGLAEGTYYWRIIAMDHLGFFGVFSDAWSFDVPAPPSSPRSTLLTPTNGADVGSGPLNFTWGAVNGATAYAIELLDAAPEQGEENTNTPSVHRIIAAVSPNGATPVFPGDTSGLAEGTYYWRIIAIDPLGLHGVFSDAWSFDVPASPPTPRPTLLTPTNGVNVGCDPLNFTWGAVNGATAYAIELLDAAPEQGEENTNTPSVHRIIAAVSPNGATPTFPGDTSGLTSGTYYWRIIAIDPLGLHGVFSDAWSFNVYAP